MSAQKIVPNVWFAGLAEEAGAFYASVLPRAETRVLARHPDGEALMVDLSVDGYRLSFLAAGPDHVPNPSISFMLNFDPLLFDGDTDAARAGLDAVWTALSDGGSVLMPLDEYPFSARYGWVADRYGVNWQLILTDPAGDPRPFLMPSLMFCGPAQNRAREAVEHYASLFPDAGWGTVAEYPEQTGPADAGDLMFADFRLAGQWFTTMDSAVAQEFTFSPGISLVALCRDQAEIDRLWEALSAVPDAERCGWLVDRYGVSWQIIPEDMGTLMQRPGAQERLLAMGKIVIAEL